MADIVTFEVQFMPMDCYTNIGAKIQRAMDILKKSCENIRIAGQDTEDYPFVGPYVKSMTLRPEK